MSDERDMIPVDMTHGSSLERSPLGDLYVRYAPEGIRLGFLLTGDRALAEDLVQEAFARLVDRLRHLRDPGAFGAYLRRTIVNRGIGDIGRVPRWPDPTDRPIRRRWRTRRPQQPIR